MTVDQRRLSFPLALLALGSFACSTAAGPGSGPTRWPTGGLSEPTRGEIFSGEDFDRYARRAVPRDAFPVLDRPTLLSSEEATLELRPDEPVIGVYLGGEARAYPVSVMGNHELANDVCGGIPIAVSW